LPGDSREKPEPERVVKEQIFTRIVCPWCTGRARVLYTKPENKRRYYECDSNCNPNDPQGARTIFAVGEKP
jgi:hypothetical protein